MRPPRPDWNKLAELKAFVKVPMHMKRLASLFLLFVLAGSTFAGVPLRFGESGCSMGGMMDMDCCKAELRQETTRIEEAELYCALSCAQNGTTLPTNTVRVTPPSPAFAPSHTALTRPLPNASFLFHPIDRLHGPPGSGSPIYLRNLALLI